MKNFFKFLGVIALVTVIGFGAAGCKGAEEEEEEEDTTTTQTDGSGLPWPDEFTTKTGKYTGTKSGDWVTSTDGYGVITFMQPAAGTTTIPGTVIFGDTSQTPNFFGLISVSGKTLKVKEFNASYQPVGEEITLCTDYTRTGTDETGTLVLTGAGGRFADIGTMEPKP
jgi:hypothetical protein